ncbi:hypothetical protein E8E11_011218 [Didymella keratinophila]|nr:hypothetical protein E8E11_011218 [Didymella keratinophila]
MADMRLFHHFLITAYPHLPVGADKIWITVIPSFAHNYEYLIHSILALSASHLDAVSNTGAAEQAIRHRILAVKSLNEALSVPPKSRSEQDARMAAALALAFQSSHLQDGLAEFLTMAFGEEGHFRQMKNRIGGGTQYSCVNHEDLDLAAISLRSIEYLSMSSFEKTYWSALNTTVHQAYDRPIEAYTSFVTLYNIPSRWTHDEFQAFIDPNNSVAQILQAHFIAVQAILTPILYLERVGFEGVNAPTAKSFDYTSISFRGLVLTKAQEYAPRGDILRTVCPIDRRNFVVVLFRNIISDSATMELLESLDAWKQDPSDDTIVGTWKFGDLLGKLADKLLLFNTGGQEEDGGDTENETRIVKEMQQDGFDGLKDVK